MATNSIDFPRGGEQIKLPQRKRRRDPRESIFKSSDKDDLTTNKKRKTIKFKTNKIAYSTPAKQLIIEKRRIPGWINHKNVTEDTILLGVVKEIQEMVALVSLPYNLIGRIDITDISAVLSQNILENDSEKSIQNIFHKGQYVVCRVKQVGKSYLGLTCDPVLVNKRVSTTAIQTGMTISGVITAKEDHGYQISFGVEGRVGFLLNKRAKTFIKTHNEGQPLSVGQVLLCHVESGGTRAVPVSIDSDKIKSATPPLIASFDNIVPFQSVECKVTNVLDSSLILEIAGGYTASCAPPHLKRVSDGLEEYNMKTVKGRVIWVRQDEKQIGVSLKKSLLQCDIAAPDGFEVGDIFEDSEIVRSETRGLFLQLRDTLVGYCPLQNISDEFLSKPDKSHRKGTTHKCRVISHNALDELAVVSLRTSVIEEKFLNFKFVRVGDIVRGKIVSRWEKGLLVSLSPHVKGYCPKGHFSERKNQSKSKSKQKKLQEGCEDTFRVLKIEPKQRVTLTHKRIIVTSALPVLSEYTDAVVGQTYHGFIAGVRDFGCVVRFFQEVRGILHKSKLQLMPLQAVSDLFCEGQVVECCVVSCEPADQKLELSLATDSVQENVDYLENFAQISLTVGGISPNGLELYNSDSNEKAALSICHLSDYKDIQQLRFKSLEKQLETNDQLIIPDIYVYTQSCSGNVCVASLKENIGRDISSDVMIQNASEVETGVLIHGVVKRVEKYGFIVGYPGGSTGLLPNRFIRDEFVDSPVGILAVGDTVLTKVMEVTEEGRFVVSSRDSDVKSQNPPDIESISYLGKWFVSYLSTRDTLLKEVSDIDQYTPGQIVSCTLVEMKKEGTIVSLSSGTNATVVGLESTELSVGEMYSSCILGVSTCPTIVYVSLNESLVESYSTEGASVSELDVGSSVQARIELVLPQYMVGLVATLHGPRLVYIIREIALSTKSFQNILEQYMNKRVNVVILNDILYSDSIGVALGLLIEGSQLSSTQKKQLIRDREDVNIGSIVTAQVKEIHAQMLKVRVGAYSGRILASEISDNPIEGKFPTKSFQKGQTVRARVMSKSLKLTDNLVKREYTVLDMTMRTSKMSLSVESIQRMQLDNIGDSCYGCVEEIWPHSNIVISIGASKSIYIPLLLCSQDINVLRDLDGHFKLGQTVQVELIKKQKKGRSTGTLISKQPIEIGALLCVQVTHVYSNQALIVSLPFGETARIEVTDISDSYSKDLTENYTDKQLLQAKVIAYEEKIIMSTRESCIGEFLVSEPVVKDRVINSIHDLTKGEILRGFVKSATDVGVFVKLSRTLTGRVRIKNMSDQFIREYKDRFPVGKLVKCKVLNIDAENGNVDLSLRLSHTNPEKFALICAQKGKPDKNKKIKEMKLRNEGGKEHNDSGDEDISDVTKVRNIIESMNQTNSDEDIEMTELDVEEMQSVPMGTQKIATSSGKKKRRQVETDPLPRLDGTGGFQWEWEKSGNDDKDLSSESETSEEGLVVRKKTKRQKRAAKRKEEESIYRAEQSLLDPNRQPECAEDFDRLLLANPNSSYLWIQYIAFHLHLADVEKAREIGKKALESINFRLEEEKLNLWISLLNLENIYGTHNSLMTLFQDGLRENDPETLHFKLAQIFINSNKQEQAQDIYTTMTRKFKSNPRVWKEYGQLLMQSGKIEQARKLCENALQKLPDKFHVEIMSKFGQFEFKHGDGERGRTIFETLLSNHPKRLDVWFVYIDTLIKYDTPDSVREICERGTALNLSVNKMKSFYKKYLTFEQSYGSEEDVNRVMENAREFVHSKLDSNSI